MAPATPKNMQLAPLGVAASLHPHSPHHLAICTDGSAFSRWSTGCAEKKQDGSIFLPNDSQVSGMVPSGSVLETRFYLKGPSRSPSSVGEGKSVGTGNSWYGMEVRNM